jgi:spore coat protein U-like protein
MRSFAFRSAFAAAALASSIAGADADTASGTIGISATVVTSCTVSASSTPVAFGTVYTNYSAAYNATGDIYVTCGNGVTYNIGLDPGGFYGTGTRNMQLSGGSALLAYQLYRTTAERTAGTPTWGMTIGTNTYAGTATGSQQTIPVYGQVPTGQTLTPGSYADTVNITVTF